MVRTDDSVIGSRGGVFGDRHVDSASGKIETISERVGWNRTEDLKL